MSGIVAGKLALVTGAGSGIGRAACQVLSREGATVISTDKNYNTAVDTLNKLMKPEVKMDSASNHTALEVDVTKSSSVHNAVKTVLDLYRTPPTIIVNSAGITSSSPFLQLTEENYDAVLDVNLKGTFLVMQAFARAMVAAGKPGSVVNLSSIIHKAHVKNNSQYTASKSGVVGLSEAAALELGTYNIRVNSISPGLIDTPILDTLTDDDLTYWQGIFEQIPMGRYGQPEEVAELIAFLGSEKSSYISGASISISGGL